MARDNKQVFRFVQQTWATATNQMGAQNYAMSASVSSTGAAFQMTTIGAAGIWYQGLSTTINRGGYRDTNADQSIIVSGETTAILNDPALFGNTNGNERYCHVLFMPFGPHVTTGQWEVLVQGASDSGTGTAGTDWTAISGAVPITSLQGNTTITTAIVAGQGSVTSHGLVVGDVLIPRVAGTGAVFAIGQPLFVVAVTPNTFDLSKTPGSGLKDTTLAITSNIFDKCVPRRALAIPITPNPKPWVRVVVRAIPIGNATQIPQWTGVLLDQAWLTMGRDSAALY